MSRADLDHVGILVAMCQVFACVSGCLGFAVTFEVSLALAAGFPDVPVSRRSGVLAIFDDTAADSNDELQCSVFHDAVSDGHVEECRCSADCVEEFRCSAVPTGLDPVSALPHLAEPVAEPEPFAEPPPRNSEPWLPPP